MRRYALGLMILGCVVGCHVHLITFEIGGKHFDSLKTTTASAPSTQDILDATFNEALQLGGIR